MKHILPLLLALLPATQGFSFLLDEVMDRPTQKETGVAELSRKQKKALETWLTDKFVLKVEPPAPTPQLSISINIQSGRQLQLSDGSLWDIAPDDINQAALWISPIPIEITPSNDPNYPQQLTNTVSKTSVKARRVQQP